MTITLLLPLRNVKKNKKNVYAKQKKQKSFQFFSSQFLHRLWKLSYQKYVRGHFDTPPPPLPRRHLIKCRQIDYYNDMPTAGISQWVV